MWGRSGVLGLRMYIPYSDYGDAPGRRHASRVTVTMVQAVSCKAVTIDVESRDALVPGNGDAVQI